MFAAYENNFKFYAFQELFRNFSAGIVIFILSCALKKSWKIRQHWRTDYRAFRFIKVIYQRESGKKTTFNSNKLIWEDSKTLWILMKTYTDVGVSINLLSVDVSIELQFQQKCDVFSLYLFIGFQCLECELTTNLNDNFLLFCWLAT